MEKFFIDFLNAISPALQILIQSLAVAFAAQASAWLLKKWQAEKLSMSSDQLYLLSVVVRSAVKAAEQLYTDSENKREYAFGVAQKALAQYGVKMDIGLIYSEIESEVYESFTAPKLINPLPK